MGGAVDDLLLEWRRWWSWHSSTRSNGIDGQNGVDEPDQSELGALDRDDQLQRAAFDHPWRAVHFNRYRAVDELLEHGAHGWNHVLLRRAGGELGGGERGLEPGIGPPHKGRAATIH